MELISIACDRCGAPLRVPSTSNFVTCQHCQTQLAIQHNDNSAWTTQLDRIDRQTQQISEQVAQLRQETQQERLNRESPRESVNPSATQPYVPTFEEPTSGLLRLGLILFGGFMLTVMSGSAIPFLLAMVAFFVMSSMKLIQWRQNQQSRLLRLLRSKSLNWPDNQNAQDPAAAIFGAAHSMGTHELMAMAMHAAQSASHSASYEVASHGEQPGAPFTAEAPAFDVGNSNGGFPGNDSMSGSFSFGASAPDVSASFPDASSSGPSFDVSMPSTDFGGSVSFDSGSSGM